MTRILLTALLFAAATGAAAAPPSEPYQRRPEVRAFVSEIAERNGFDADAVLGLFRQAKPDPAVIKAITPPADPGARSWQSYRARFLDAKRIANGLEFWRNHEATLARAQAIYGVPAEIVVAIIGVETLYGRHTGQFEVFNALTNLAFDYPPRAELFRRELEALLLLAREQGRNPWDYRGSYAGAIGYPQFLPSSIRKYAVDFNRDGRIDLSGSAEDAIGSVAHFLYQHGWESGDVIALPARLVESDTKGSEWGPAPLLAEGIFPKRLPADLARFGIEADGAPEKAAALIDLATPNAQTEYRLGFNNFYVLTRYNRSSFYAAAVTDLAEALRAAWYPTSPSDRRPPTPSARLE
jgi:membrane-bound lytic murein transglycosylase B